MTTLTNFAGTSDNRFFGGPLQSRPPTNEQAPFTDSRARGYSSSSMSALRLASVFGMPSSAARLSAV
ncbi:MAG TPA: hypothetical protein VFM91_00940, partial [Propionibacteriaceae bacterium]|nr:hypothetical protein [Propionibacteriaceae bacterium]